MLCRETPSRAQRVHATISDSGELVSPAWSLETSRRRPKEKAKEKKMMMMIWWTIRQLRSKSEHNRKKAAEQLGESRSLEAVEPLIAVLLRKREDNAVRMCAADALAKIGDPRAVDALVAVFKNQDVDFDESFVQMHAAQALGTIGGPGAFDALVEAIQVEPGSGPKFFVRPLLGEEVARALVRLGDSRAVEHLIRALEVGNCRAIIEALVHFKTVAFTPLVTSLTSKNPIQRQQAAETLGEIADSRAFEPLVAALKDEDSSVQEEVAIALGRIRHSRSFEVLVPLLDDPVLRAAAAEALGVLQDPRGLEPLLEVLETYSPLDDLDWAGRRVTRATFTGLGRLLNGRAADPLLNWLFSYDGSELRDCQGTIERALLVLLPSTSLTKELLNIILLAAARTRDSDAAVEQLCLGQSAVTSNLLHLITLKDDYFFEVSDDVGWSESANTGQKHLEVVTFQSQRDAAARELSRRGNPPYQPDAYLKCV